MHTHLIILHKISNSSTPYINRYNHISYTINHTYIWYLVSIAMYTDLNYLFENIFMILF